MLKKKEIFHLVSYFVGFYLAYIYVSLFFVCFHTNIFLLLVGDDLHSENEVEEGEGEGEGEEEDPPFQREEDNENDMFF